MWSNLLVRDFPFSLLPTAGFPFSLGTPPISYPALAGLIGISYVRGLPDVSRLKLDCGLDQLIV